MLDLALDGSLLWARWALRRVGYFNQGRPETLIRDLIGDPNGAITFYSGDLGHRLVAANLGALEDKHARAIGVAVGQRAARETFNVRIDGVQACISDPDLARWPAAYRLGAASGLLFSPEEHPTITAQNLRDAIQLCLSAPDASEDITALLTRVVQLWPASLTGSDDAITSLGWWIQQARDKQPGSGARHLGNSGRAVQRTALRPSVLMDGSV